jgi:hypothetical protein
MNFHIKPNAGRVALGQLFDINIGSSPLGRTFDINAGRAALGRDFHFYTGKSARDACSVTRNLDAVWTFI